MLTSSKIRRETWIIESEYLERWYRYWQITFLDILNDELLKYMINFKKYMISFSKVSILNFKNQRLLTLNIEICIVWMNELIVLLGNHLFTSRNRWSYKRGSILCIYAFVLESNSVQELRSNSVNENRPIGSIETNSMNVRRTDYAPFVLLSNGISRW